METCQNNESLTHEALKECDRLIAHFDLRASRHKRFFKSLSIASIVLTASVTALLGILRQEYHVATILVAALATITAGILASSQAQHLWVISRSTSQKLVAEKFLFLQQASPYADLETTEERAKRFSVRVVQIWNEGHTSWQDRVSDVDSSASPKQ